VFSGAEHVRRNADGVTARLQRLDRRARGDAAHHRHRNRTAIVVLGAATDPAEGALDHAGREATATATAAAGRKLRKLDHLNCASAIRQAANEAALFQCSNETVDTRLRAQVQRVLHLVEGGRNAGFLQAFTDEPQKLILFARKHLDQSPGC
jgi:hypothetical protein